MFEVSVFFLLDNLLVGHHQLGPYLNNHNYIIFKRIIQLPLFSYIIHSTVKKIVYD